MTSLAFSGLMRPSPSPTASGTEPTASITIAAASDPARGAEGQRSGQCGAGAAEADDLLVRDLERFHGDRIAHDVERRPGPLHRQDARQVPGRDLLAGRAQ